MKIKVEKSLLGQTYYVTQVTTVEKLLGSFNKATLAIKFANSLTPKKVKAKKATDFMGVDRVYWTNY